MERGLLGFTLEESGSQEVVWAYFDFVLGLIRFQFGSNLGLVWA